MWGLGNFLGISNTESKINTHSNVLNEIDVDIDSESKYSENESLNDSNDNDTSNDSTDNESIKDDDMKIKIDINLRKCQRCKSPYTEAEFGLNKKNKPYMNCKLCRDKQLESDSKRKNDPKRIESNNKNHKKYMDEHREEINRTKKEEYRKNHPRKTRQTVEERQRTSKKGKRIL